MTVTDERSVQDSWAAVRERVAGRFTIAAQGDNWVGFRWVIGENKILRFKIAVSALGGDEQVLVMSPAAGERDLLPKHVMQEAAAIGPAVVIEEGLYVVRQWVSLSDVGGPALDRAIALVADAVLRLQTHVARTPSSRVSAGRPFANFAD